MVSKPYNPVNPPPGRSSPRSMVCTRKWRAWSTPSNHETMPIKPWPCVIRSCALGISASTELSCFFCVSLIGKSFSDTWLICNCISLMKYWAWIMTPSAFEISVDEMSGFAVPLARGELWMMFAPRRATPTTSLPIRDTSIPTWTRRWAMSSLLLYSGANCWIADWTSERFTSCCNCTKSLSALLNSDWACCNFCASSAAVGSLLEMGSRFFTVSKWLTPSRATFRIEL